MAKFELKLTKEQQQLIVAIVLLASAAGYSYWAYFWTPISEKIKIVNQKIEETDRDIQSARATAARLPQLRAQIQDLQEKAEAGEKKLPKSKELPKLIDTLSSLARQYNVTIITFAPGPSATKDYFIELQYGMTVRGTYHSLAKFLTALATQERIFQSRNLTLSPIQGSNPNESVTAQFTLLAFQYKG